MRRIDWRHQNQRLVLPVAILPSASAPNALTVERTIGLLDTGATATAIRADVAARLGLKPKGRRRVFTANGDIMASEYLFRIGFFGGEADTTELGATEHPYVLDREVLGFDLSENFNYPVLVGMDVLGVNDLEIRRDGTATLIVK